MEAYKSSCPDCGAVYYWQGYKTALGKTPDQIEAWRRRQTICKECLSPRLKTELDRESEVGKEYDEIYKDIANIVATHLDSKVKEKE